MGETLAEKIDTMLASVQEELDDSELSFKLRTARQLIVAYDTQLQQHGKALDESTLGDDTIERLSQLGYLE
jgi:hypothetical protein